MLDSVDDRIIVEWRNGRDLVGSYRGSIDIRSWHLPGGTRENHEYLSQDSKCHGRNSNRVDWERNIQIYNDVSVKHNKTFIMFIIIPGQQVRFL